MGKGEYGFGDPAGEHRVRGGLWLHLELGDQLEVIVLNDEPYRYESHWVGGRSTGCSGAACDFCRAHLARQWRWVLSVQDSRSAGVCLLEIGAPCAAGMQVQLEQTGEQLKGSTWLLSKTGRGRGTVGAHLLGMAVNSVLVPGLDLKAELERQWYGDDTAGSD